jgi:hypothetical protein
VLCCLPRQSGLGRKLVRAVFDAVPEISIVLLFAIAFAAILAFLPLVGQRVLRIGVNKETTKLDGQASNLRSPRVQTRARIATSARKLPLASTWQGGKSRTSRASSRHCLAVIAWALSAYLLYYYHAVLHRVLVVMSEGSRAR